MQDRPILVALIKMALLHIEVQLCLLSTNDFVINSGGQHFSTLLLVIVCCEYQSYRQSLSIEALTPFIVNSEKSIVNSEIIVDQCQLSF